MVAHTGSIAACASKCVRLGILFACTPTNVQQSNGCIIDSFACLQDGFINFIVRPLFEAFVTIFPDTRPLMFGVEANGRYV